MSPSETETNPPGRWLKTHGFERNPFPPLDDITYYKDGQLDDKWIDLFVQYPNYKQLEEFNKSFIVLVKWGGGKTTTLTYLDLLLKKPEYSTILSVPYNNFVIPDHNNPITRDYHDFPLLEEIGYALYPRLLDYIAQEKLKDADLEQWMVFLTYICDGGSRRMDSIARAFANSKAQEWWHHAKSSTKVSRYQLPQDLVNRRFGLISLLKTINYNKIVMLVDKVDQRALSARDKLKLEAVLDQLMTVEWFDAREELVWRFFLPETFRGFTERVERRLVRRLGGVISVEWSEHDLVALIRNRFQWAAPPQLPFPSFTRISDPFWTSKVERLLEYSAAGDSESIETLNELDIREFTQEEPAWKLIFESIDPYPPNVVFEYSMAQLAMRSQDIGYPRAIINLCQWLQEITDRYMERDPNLVGPNEEIWVELVRKAHENGYQAKQKSIEHQEGFVIENFVPGYIISIGINEYDNLESLNYAEDDARDVFDRFQQMGYQTFGFEDEISSLLIGRDVTPDSVYKIITKLSEPSDDDPNKTIIVFLAGHASPWENRDTEGLCLPKYAPYSAQNHNELGIIPFSDLHQWFTKLTKRYRTVIVFADTCYAGLLTQKPPLKSRDVKPSPPPPRSFQATDKEGQWILVASSQASQRTYETDELGHGVFTNFLLEGLNNNALYEKDGNLYLPALYNHISEQMAFYYATRGESNSQSPTMLPGIRVPVARSR